MEPRRVVATSALTAFLLGGAGLPPIAHAAGVPKAPTGTASCPGLLPGSSPTPKENGDAAPPAVPTPPAAGVVAPDATLGGPALARTGVVTDLATDGPTPPDLPHLSYVLADLGTGDVLAAKAAHARLAPASTLKVLTALVALPRLDPQEVVVATSDDVAAEGTRVGMLPGNPYRVEDLFSGMLLMSGNDAAYALARAYGGREAMVAEMNATAAHLGALDTKAVDPSGLDAEGQCSSAYDLALVGRAALALPQFRRYAQLPMATFPGGTDSAGGAAPAFQIQNLDPLLRYPGRVAGKSGYTTMAANTFVGAVTRGERTLLVAAMGSAPRQTESLTALLDWGFAHAAQARAVGVLVAPGTPERPSPAGAGTSGPSADAAPTSAVPVPGGADSVVAISLAGGVARTGWPGSAWLVGPLAAAALVVAGLLWRRHRLTGSGGDP